MAADENDQTVAPSLDVVKHFRLAAVDSCQGTARGLRGQGRQPRAARAERKRGHAQRLERASREPHNHCATAEDRDVDLHGSTPPPCTSPTATSLTEAETSWRERPRLWPRAWQPRRPEIGVAHATTLRMTASVMTMNRAGGRERRPTSAFNKSMRRLGLARGR